MKLWLLFLINVTAVLAQTPNPDLPPRETLTKKYLEALSKREIGQKKFVLKENNWGQDQQQDGQEQGEERDIQESDVFKIGNPAKKELFLLNNYRGFQVVSFKDGLESPRLLSRLPIHNNWGSEMYYQKDQEQVIVVNTEWSYSQNSWGSHYDTTIYVIDVADSAKPRVAYKKKINGSLESSRLVGNILYTITHDGRWSENSESAITSLRLDPGSIKQIEQVNLHSGKRWARHMNVVKNTDKYYVITSLTKWSDGDMVAVHDITSPAGDIKKIMTAQAKGNVLERSQAFIHKGHLFAVSNYQVNSGPVRIAVEAYPLKTTNLPVYADPARTLTIGDTTGLHASLQDVRVNEDLLYAFWVPANNIDPFELIDISNPAAGLKHLGQLQFDGWVSKAFPLNYKNRKFVLGLGWIVPPTSEDGKRYPQAKLFEIKNVNGQYKHDVLSSLTLDTDDLWGDMNDEDKKFEILEEAPGQFNILFPVTFEKSWQDGAKVVNLDLNTTKISEGASVIGKDEWLNRIFTNRDLHALHTFGDRRLENFDLGQISQAGFMKAVSVLELARNILDFVPVTASHGVQVVKADDTVELRSVSLTKSDAELTEVQDVKAIKGEYEWHMVKGTSLYAITTFYKPGGSEWNRDFDHAELSVVDLKTGDSSSTKIDVTLPTDDDYFYFYVSNISSGKNEFFTIGDAMFILEGNALRKLSIASECRYFFNNEDYGLSLTSLGTDIYAYNAFQVSPVDGRGDEEKYTYSFPFTKKLDFKDGVITCGDSLNVPAKPVLATEREMVAAESSWDWYEEKMKDEISYTYVPSNSKDRTFALLFNGAELELTDILNKNITGRVLGNDIITFDDHETRLDVWSVNEEGQFVSRSQYLSYDEDDVELITAREMGKRKFFFFKAKEKVDVFELTAQNRLENRPVTSTYDTKQGDGSAEFVFDIRTINFSPDQRRFFVSQGLYGVTDIILQ